MCIYIYIYIGDINIQKIKRYHFLFINMYQNSKVLMFSSEKWIFSSDCRLIKKDNKCDGPGFNLYSNNLKKSNFHTYMYQK